MTNESFRALAYFFSPRPRVAHSPRLFFPFSAYARFIWKKKADSLNRRGRKIGNGAGDCPEIGRIFD